MDVVAEAVAHRLLPCRVLMDEKPPKFSHLGADRLHRHTCNQEMAVAPGSGHVSTSSPAVTQSASHASVTFLFLYWVSDEVSVNGRRIHVMTRQYGRRPSPFRREQEMRSGALALSVVLCPHCFRVLAHGFVCRHLSFSLLWLSCSCWSLAG